MRFYSSLIFTFYCLLVIAVIGGCFYGISMVKEERFEKEDVIAVYMHDAWHYSVLTEAGSNLVHRVFGSVKPEILRDVLDGSNMWYEAYYKETYDHGGYEWLKIHIRSVDDINTAGWNHGKFGRGMTHRVQ